ncbi:MAG: hypothetical protein COY80_02475 [Candidatus Pacebacteria bacterium CG_4_10_14_0_8_um_filter_42_14]|nr:MAG: hypothetical protein COY80_02475 [Candidatus Pacebacteria bacterium CG_4_10_14_0_8_um_filter_42_14]
MENITPKQLQILILLYRFRFLNRTQIQQFLNHKSPRRLNNWLKDLTERKILGRNYSTKLKENTKPAVYYLASKSRKILLDLPDINKKVLNRAYRDKNSSQKLIDHSIFVASLYFLIREETKTKKSVLHFFTKTDLVTHYYLPYNRPDAYIAIEKENTTKRYFLEVIDEGTPRFMLRKKILQYIEYFDENTWKKRTLHKNPSLLFICPNQNIKDFLNKYIAQVLEEETSDVQFFLSLKSDILRGGSNSWEIVG